MKPIKKIFAAGLAVMMALSLPFSVSAAALDDGTTIDESRTGSLTIYKYDLTGAEKDGVCDSSYVSTGIYDENGVNNVLGGNASTLGNGETGYGYAIKGIEFSFVKVADIVQFSESEADSRTDGHVEVLYAVDKSKGADFLKTLGLTDGKSRYENADALDESKYFYQSDVLISALSSGLTSNSTTVKNAMERYAAANGTAMALTDSYGKTKAENLPLGLYLVAETKVPEMVVSTTDPFLVSVPMTSVNGANAADGGTRWIYDITLYPKNLTGIPSLEKTLREAKADTGKTDAYAHTGTASAGDTIDYQIISTLPSNSVIAGHRGWNGADYFRYIPNLVIGDKIQITNLWETLEYTVTGSKIISPNDVEAIKIQPGKDMITLFTCHPYASGGRQRYLVFCERTTTD